MRADRLLSLLILLQTRGQMTARRLAEELEVSERTIYRDIEALGAAGVPVYAERGPGGGCALLESYRTNLTGLNESEVRALFMLSIPAPLVELGVGAELKAALLKLSAALPAGRQLEQEQVRQRIYLDSEPWFHSQEVPPHLQEIHRAVWQGLRLDLAYSPMYGTVVKQRVDPYGLVCKAGAWHLVAARGGALRVYRLASIKEAAITEERFERPADFDLAGFWSRWCAGGERSRPAYPVTVRISPELIPYLPYYFGDSIRSQLEASGPADSEGRVILTLVFERLEAARERLLGFGRGLEVLEPQALRLSMIDYAQQVAARYR